jgi:hypothetical protein
MAETFGTVIDSIASQLAGFVTDPPMYATLENTIQTGTLSLKLDLPAQAQPQGVVEIDQELIHIATYDPQTNTATVPAWGRAQQGTTAAAHVAGAKVTINPKYPRKRIGAIVNQVVASMCPPLFAVQRGSFTTVPLTREYALPVSTRNLLNVEYRPYGSQVYDWMPMRSAFVKRDSGSPMLHVDDAYGNASCEVRYTVACNPVPFLTEATLFTASGLPESCVDIVHMGAIPRLLSTTELAKQQLTSVEASERAVLIPSGSGAATVRLYMQMYEARLNAEAKRLRQEYPLRAMRTV